MKRVVIDLDGTLTTGDTNDYANVGVNQGVRKQLIAFKEKGYEIVVFTARNMRTHKGNMGKINKHTLPIILDWLEKHDIPFDEVIVGKPWCGTDGFYVDDKAIRPSEFASMSEQEIRSLLDEETTKCS